MKRRNRLLIALLAALVTFGSLYAFTGPLPGFAHRGHYHDRKDCGGWSHRKSGNPTERPTDRQAPTQTAPAKNN
jgi:hypothetical protein